MSGLPFSSVQVWSIKLLFEDMIGGDFLCQAFWKRESSWVNQPLHEIMIQDCQNMVGTVCLRMNMCDYAKDIVEEGPTNRIEMVGPRM
ncbi:MAG: hypothetical protein WBF33_01920 [Candidatus Nitrosopolaris sp.]